MNKLLFSCLTIFIISTALLQLVNGDWEVGCVLLIAGFVSTLLTVEFI